MDKIRLIQLSYVELQIMHFLSRLLWCWKGALQCNPHTFLTPEYGITVAKLILWISSFSEKEIISQTTISSVKSLHKKLDVKIYVYIYISSWKTCLSKIGIPAFLSFLGAFCSEVTKNTLPPFSPGSLGVLQTPQDQSSLPDLYRAAWPMPKPKSATSPGRAESWWLKVTALPTDPDVSSEREKFSIFLLWGWYISDHQAYYLIGRGLDS